jgi:hypothetical protein
MPAALADGRKQLKTNASKTNESNFFIGLSLYIPLQIECQLLNAKRLGFPTKIASGEDFSADGEKLFSRPALSAMKKPAR